MDLGQVHKKIAEAHSFLRKMTDQESRIIGDTEFDNNLSAFLNAARTVDYRLRHEQGAIYKPWRKAWDARLAPEQRSLMKFIDDDRAKEVHDSGSSRNVRQEGVKFGIGTHHLDGGGTLTIGGIPTPLSGIESAATIYKPTYSFTIDGTDRKVTEVCGTHLALLQKMVADFEADHP
jgi:hypothetical protein